MATKIRTLLQEFGVRLGLGTELDLTKDGTIRLNLEHDFGIDFEEDAERNTLWMYIELEPGVDVVQSGHFPELLKIMFRYHRNSDARLIIDPQGYSLLLASGFVVPAGEADEGLLDQLEEHIKTFIGIAEVLRAPLHQDLKGTNASSVFISPFQKLA